jgi:hypothetical protein
VISCDSPSPVNEIYGLRLRSHKNAPTIFGQ